MKTLFLLKHCQAGNGHVHVAVDLACSMARAGDEVIFASSGGSYEALLQSYGVDHVTIQTPSGLRGAAKSISQVLALVVHSQPDIIHAHMMGSAVMGALSSLLTGIPLVTTMHNSFDPHSVLMRLGTTVIAVSEAERQLLLSRGYPAHKVVTILNGAKDSPRESLAQGSVSVSTPCVMTLSGLHKRKGVQDVITAFSYVSGEFPRWHLNIVGEGPDQDLLEQQAVDLGVAESIHFVGASMTASSLLAQADIFASASLAEPFGLAVAEARAAGCAVVATDVGGVPEVLDHGRAGMLTSVSQPSELADKFRELMKNPETLALWKGRAQWGSEYFTVSRMTQDYRRLYALIVDERSGNKGRLFRRTLTRMLMSATARPA